TKLKATLQRLLLKYTFSQKMENLDMAFSLAPVPDEIDQLSSQPQGEFPTMAVRLAFFRFFVSLFQKYKQYIEKPQSRYFDIKKCFKTKQFIRDSHESAKPFLEQFLESQAFQRFLIQRITEEKSPETIFFDESIDAKLNRSKLKLHKK